MAQPAVAGSLCYFVMLLRLACSRRLAHQKFVESMRIQHPFSSLKTPRTSLPRGLPDGLLTPNLRRQFVRKALQIYTL